MPCRGTGRVISGLGGTQSKVPCPWCQGKGVRIADVDAQAAQLPTPLRRRVQRAVDRRFNRARYDADQTVAAFAARLKDAVDLDSVRDDLATVVHRTLEPVHVSVWLTSRD